MENTFEGLEPQKTQVTEVQVNKIELSAEEYADLKHKAEVSSQNFERAKKAEIQLREFESINNNNEVPSSDIFSDEGRALKREIEEQNEKIAQLLQENAKKDVLNTFPILKDKWSEFDSYRNDPENKGMSIQTAAKAFMHDSGLFEPTRKGLEKPTGGQRTPVNQAQSPEDIKTLRETNFRKYRAMLAKGEIKV
jgi:hypothetical protein